jgi:hypothetical protein
LNTQGKQGCSRSDPNDCSKSGNVSNAAGRGIGRSFGRHCVAARRKDEALMGSQAEAVAMKDKRSATKEKHDAPVNLSIA